MAACTTVGRPLAAPQAAGHHTAVDSVVLLLVAAALPGDPGAYHSQGAGSNQGPDAPRLAPNGFRHQAASGVAQPLAQVEVAGHDSGAVPAALMPRRRSLQPARGRAGAAHHPLDAMHPAPLPPHTQAQHLPPLARACLIRAGAMCRSTVSALHVTCH